jgi:hypothetical protein
VIAIVFFLLYKDYAFAFPYCEALKPTKRHMTFYLKLVDVEEFHNYFSNFATNHSMFYRVKNYRQDMG